MALGFRLLGIILTLSANAVPTLAASEQRFAVASIKLHAPENPAEGMQVRPDGIDYTRVTLFECIREAYHVAEFQIIGADRFGDAMLSKRYDIIARAEKTADKIELMSMLQTLLAERFKLRFHRETKDLPVFVIESGKEGTAAHNRRQ